MSKRIHRALRAVTLCMLAAPGSGFAATTLHWVERTSNEHEVDLAPAGDSHGDLIVFANPLFDAADVKPLGESNGFCLRTDPGRSWQCEWTMRVAEGRLNVSGTYRDAGDSDFAITGGGGRYAGARGTLHLHPRNGGHTSYDFIIKLL